MNAPATVNIAAVVVRLIAEQVGHTTDDIARENALEDLGVDSLDLIELVMALEDEFSITIEDEEAEPLRTVGQVIDLVMKKRADPEATVP